MSDFLRREIYPALHDKALKVLPEFAFKPHARGWVATAKLDIDGTTTKSPKIYWYSDNPQSLWSQKQGQSVSLWDYIAQRDGLNTQDTKVVLHHLANLAGVTLQPLSSRHRPQTNGIDPALFRDALPWLCAQLWHNPEAAPVRQYLLEGRGYSEDQCRAMQLGFMGDRTALTTLLEAKGHNPKRIAFFLRRKKPDEAVPFASTHRLVIPVWGQHGSVAGFCFRATAQEAAPKYLNSYGLNKSAALLSFARGATHVTIVEGILDAAVAKARGLPNVVPLNGSSLNVAQLTTLHESGIQSLTLCLDNDRAGAAARKRIMKIVMDEGIPLRVYIARLPDCVKDPDDLMRLENIDAFTAILENAQGLGGYLGQRLAAQYIQQPQSPQQRDTFLNRSATIESKLLFPVDREDFQQRLAPALRHFSVSLKLYQQSIAHRMQLAVQQLER